MSDPSPRRKKSPMTPQRRRAQALNAKKGGAATKAKIQAARAELARMTGGPAARGPRPEGPRSSPRSIADYEAAIGTTPTEYVDAVRHTEIRKNLLALKAAKIEIDKARRKLVPVEELHRMVALVRDLLQRAKLASGSAMINVLGLTDLAERRRMGDAAEKAFGMILDQVISDAARLTKADP